MLVIIYSQRVYFTWRRFLLILLTSFYGYNTFRCIYTNSHSKTKIKFPFTNSNILGYVLEWYFSRFPQKTKKHSFWPESVFSLSYKISFADLWPLFMERIVNMSHLRMQSRARWNSCSARSYSDCKMEACSRVTLIAVRSLALLQLVNLKPENNFGQRPRHLFWRESKKELTFDSAAHLTGKLQHFDILILIGMDGNFELLYQFWQHRRLLCTK